MTDPLSITVSAITILATCSACVKQLHDFARCFRHAPGEILALSNEISDMSVVVTEVRAAFEDHGTKLNSEIHHDPKFHDLVDAQLTRAKQILIELTILTKSLSTGACVKRLLWAKEKQAAKKLQADLKDIRETLHMLLGVKTSSRTARIELAIESLNAVSLQNCRESQGLLAQILHKLRDPDSTWPLSEEQNTYLDFTSLMPANQVPLLIPPVDSEKGNGLSSNTVPSDGPHLQDEFSTISFQMHTMRRPCATQCGCACHKQRRLRSPEILSKFFGALFIGYTGLPVMNTKCDDEICKNGASFSLDITYCFPQWFLARAIYLVVAKPYTGEPMVSLTVRRRVDHTRRPNILRLARSGNIEAIRTLLDGREAFLNDIEASNGRTALQVRNPNRDNAKLVKEANQCLKHAIFHGHLGTCKFLLQQGANPYLMDDFGMTSVEEAWRFIFLGTGKPELVNGLKSLFPSIEYDDWGLEELHKIILGILPLDLGTQLQKPVLQAQVNLPDNRGRTPLHWASLRGDAHGVDKLLLAGADPNCQAFGKDTPLHCAAISQNPRVYELLLMAGANPVFVNSWGDTALNCACNHRDVVACIKLLMRSRANGVLNHRNRGGDTPLLHAAGRNNPRIASLLLDFGADMHIKNLGGETPLFVAIVSDSHDIIELLLRRGDNCTNIAVHGSTVLHYAAQYGDIKTANILLASDLRALDPDAVDFQGRTPMEVLEKRTVSQEGFEETFKALVAQIKEAQTTDLDFEHLEKYSDALEW